MKRPVSALSLLLTLPLALGCATYGPSATGAGASASGTAPAPNATPPARSVTPGEAATERPDPHSFARPAEAAVEHLKLDLTVDFPAKKLAGRASLRLANHGATRLHLDTRDLDIQRVTLDDGTTEAKEAKWTLGEVQPHLGQELTVEITPATRWVSVDYSTRPEAAALQWLSPEQAGGTQPFLFTQSQAILARTWIPLQDSPGVRMTYEATIRAPAGPARRDERREPDGEERRRRLPLQDAAGHPVLPDRPRRSATSPSGPSARPAQGRRLCPAVGRRARRLGARRHAEDDRRRREALRPLPLGALRPARPAAELPLRRHGEPAAHLRHPHHPRRRPLAGLAGRPRARPLLVRQPGHQRHLERLLAQRGLHHLLRAPHHGGGLRPRL